MLSAALVIFAVTRPAPAPAPATIPVHESMSSAEIDHRIQAAVSKAVAESEARQTANTLKLVSGLERRAEGERKLRMVAEWDLDRMERRTRATFYSANRDSYGPPRAEQGESK
jgi:hypothetical protein